jgi:hypothetical protein
MQLLVVRLADTVEAGVPGNIVQHYRHWITYPDGRIFYQDETIYIEWEKELVSARTDWIQLPTPPQARTLVSLGRFGHGEDSTVLAACSDGRVFHWDGVTWKPFQAPVPGTPADVEDNGYNLGPEDPFL